MYFVALMVSRCFLPDCLGCNNIQYVNMICTKNKKDSPLTIGQFICIHAKNIFIQKNVLDAKAPRTLIVAKSDLLIILFFQFKEALWVIANRTYLGSFLTHNDVATVATLPNAIAIAREDYFIFNIF